VVEEVSEGDLFEVEAGVRYVNTQKTVRGGEAVRQGTALPRAPRGEHVLRRPAAGKTGSSRSSRQPHARRENEEQKRHR
jgi:hypothetical protein